MKKLFLTILFLPAILFSQTKPQNPQAPSGSWATDLFRAYVFSRADSVSVDSLKDWSSNNVWGVTNGNAANWVAAGTEGPGYEHATATNGRFTCGTLNGSGITDSLTILIRFQTKVSTGTNWHGITAPTDRFDTPQNTFRVKMVGGAGSSLQVDWCIANTAETCTSGNLGSLPIGTLITLICTYAGDSLRLYADGVYKGATAKTGNIILDSNYGLIIGLTAESGTYFYFSGGYTLMECIWKRVLTSDERTQIWANPYVMFGTETPAATTRGRIIMIQ